MTRYVIQLSKISIFTILILFCNLLLSTDDKKDSEIMGYPQLSYATETGFVGGMQIYYLYRPRSNPYPIPRNKLILDAKYSQKKQFYSRFEPEFYLFQGDYYFNALISYMNWPSEYYGIGNNSKEENEESYTPEMVNISIDFKKIFGKVNISALYDFEHFQILKSEEDGVLATGMIPGSEKHLISGTGAALEWDSRDNTNFPTKGEYVSLKGILYRKFLGSDYSFEKLTLNMRKYFTLSKSQWLAIQFFSGKIFGDYPFPQLFQLDDFSRGYITDLFRDTNITASRLEYRTFPFRTSLLNNVGFVAFAEAGQVAENLKSYALGEIKLSGGFGLRYSLFPKERLNLRFDVGFGKDSMNISVGGGEEF